MVIDFKAFRYLPIISQNPAQAHLARGIGCNWVGSINPQQGRAEQDGESFLFVFLTFSEYIHQMLLFLVNTIICIQER